MIVAKESYNREEVTSIINEEEVEEAVETLSLCDLPIYSDESNCDEYSKQDDHSASFDINEEDTFFEFFSDDSSVSNSIYSGSDNIIFCGKLIPYKQPNDSQNKAEKKNCQIRTKSHTFNGEKSSVIDSRENEIGFTKTRRRGVKSFDPFSISFSKDSEYNKRKRSWKMEKCELLEEERAMILQPSPTKSRWFVFLFGSARFPKEMELSEMRTRQQRSSRTAMLRPSEERKVATGRRGKKTMVTALWKVLRALVIGCSSGRDQNGAVKGPFMPISVV